MLMLVRMYVGILIPIKLVKVNAILFDIWTELINNNLSMYAYFTIIFADSVLI